MARPERRNCDYFPYYAKDGRTLFILEGKYKAKGTGFFTNVLRFLTLENDHHFCISDETDKMYFFTKCHIDEETGMDMLDIMSKTQKIHSGLWVSSAVIVSEDLLESLKDAYRKRKNQIITIEEILEKYVNDAVNEVSGDVNPQEGDVSGANKPQTKVKETKGKKSKRKFTPPTEKDVVNYFHEKGYRIDVARRAFEFYDTANWKDSTGKQVKNWKQKMIGVWFKDENKKKKPGEPDGTF